MSPSSAYFGLDLLDSPLCWKTATDVSQITVNLSVRADYSIILSLRSHVIRCYGKNSRFLRCGRRISTVSLTRF